MCGIAGVAGMGEGAQAEDAVRRMLTHLERRGPDSGGVLAWPTAVLGHRRLAIFDLTAAGHQPMTSADGSVAIVFNGAIYNFRDLRDELIARGSRFVSQTDTEVLIQGYRAWGIDELVRRCRGMFAFGLWDSTRGALFLVRDRLGVKPLVYSRVGDGIVFASTVRALRAAGVASEIEPQGVVEFLEHGYIPDSTSIYKGISKLPPASIGEWRAGVWRTKQYWDPPVAGAAGAVSFDEAVERTEELLTQAVGLRLFADVPVGALLSGGVDSALVCWGAASQGAKVTAFTVATPGQSTDESRDAQATAKELGIDVEILPMSDEDAPDLDQLTTAFAEPFATQSALGLLRVSQAIREAGIKVVLTGDGGDDVFLGYPRHRHMLAVQRVAARMPTAALPAWKALRPLIPAVSVARRARHFGDYVTGGLGSYLRAHDGLPRFAEAGLLGERLVDLTPTSRIVAASPQSARRLLNEYLAHDRHHQFTGEYLTKVDGATMHYGLEARAPFFDQDLWEYAASLPHDIRLRNGELKAVLRAVARRRVSERVARGSKRGFSIPVERWIAGRWRTEIGSRLRESILCDEGWISRSALDRALRNPKDRGPGAHHLWYLVVLDNWMRAEREPRAPRAESVPVMSDGGD